MTLNQHTYLMELSPAERNIFHVLHTARYQRYCAMPNSDVSIEKIAEKAIHEGVLLLGEHHNIPAHQETERRIVSRILQHTQDVTFCLEPGMTTPVENPDDYETHTLWRPNTTIEFSLPMYLINHNIQAANKLVDLVETPKNMIIGICGNNHIRSTTHSIQYFTLMQGIMPVVVTQQEELGNCKFSELYYNLGSRKSSKL